jgi:hypothetical protein
MIVGLLVSFLICLICLLLEQADDKEEIKRLKDDLDLSYDYTNGLKAREIHLKRTAVSLGYAKVEGELDYDFVWITPKKKKGKK